MKSITRMLDMRLPDRQSAFLWGARKTGKSTYLREKFPRIKVGAGEAVQCPTLLYNGHGSHRIEGIGRPGATCLSG